MSKAKPEPMVDEVIPLSRIDGCDHFVLYCDFLGDAVPLESHRSLVDAMCSAAVLHEKSCTRLSPSEFFAVMLWCFRGGKPVATVTLYDDRWKRTDGHNDLCQEGVAVWGEIYPIGDPRTQGSLF